MNKRSAFFAGGIRQKIFGMLLITIILIIAAYTVVFFYQTNKVEQLVNETYEAQEQLYIENGLQYQYKSVRNNAVDRFHTEMFHARNILILLVVLIVAAGMTSSRTVRLSERMIFSSSTMMTWGDSSLFAAAWSSVFTSTPSAPDRRVIIAASGRRVPLSQRAIVDWLTKSCFPSLVCERPLSVRSFFSISENKLLM